MSFVPEPPTPEEYFNEILTDEDRARLLVEAFRTCPRHKDILVHMNSLVDEQYTERVLEAVPHRVIIGVDPAGEFGEYTGVCLYVTPLSGTHRLRGWNGAHNIFLGND